jgi:CheY-like chemotaxis protein
VTGAAAATRAAADRALTRRRVVIVEDHPETAEGLAELVAIWGYEPHVARTGEDALELVAAVAPDVVISDVGLPGIDGYEMASRIRHAAAGRHIMLLAVTGSPPSAAGGPTPFDHELPKPIDLDVLEHLLESGVGDPVR